jgi:hypothetical protein
MNYLETYKSKLELIGPHLSQSKKKTIAFLLDRTSVLARKFGEKETQKLLNFLIKKWKCNIKQAREMGYYTVTHKKI